MDPETGTPYFTDGDNLIVANGGKYVGTLTYNGSCFSGTISDVTDGLPLHFYFLGNEEPLEELSAGISETCSVVIADQTEHLPVISYAPSNEIYEWGRTAYTARLMNKCALVKFVVQSVTDAPLVVVGPKNKVTIDFEQASFEYGEESSVGYIKLSGGDGEKWAILLPQDPLEPGEMGTAYSEDFEYTGTHGAIPVIHENSYLTAGISVTVNTLFGDYAAPEGAVKGRFTVNANGGKVYFSKGNLQYIGSASEPYWKFAEHQWDYLGETTDQTSSNANVDRDLFGWGTSGYNHGAVCYQPWSTSAYSYNYYAYGYSSYNLYDQTGKADWGYNCISNGGNEENLWRCLTTSEWSYILGYRSTISNIRFAKATVKHVKGLIILPDDWNVTVYQLYNCDDPTAPYSSNIINDVSKWTTMEANGAVFLPAAGSRSTNPYTGAVTFSNVGTNGNYWLSTSTRTYVFFQNDKMNGGGARADGFSVRLVQNVVD